jgi:peptidoglycan/xylan/chitin deacetylase (PgdA/CDA1 family)
MKYWIKTPFLIPYLFTGLIWRFSSKSPILYLTFDDGPSNSVTEAILKILKEAKVSASFFCVGKNVKKNQDLFKKIKANGHSIGNHSMTHPNGWKVDKSIYLKDIQNASKLINSNLFRPPYGKINFKSISSLKKTFKIIMWDIVSGDFDNSLSTETVVNNVVKNARNGSVIVLHDNDSFKDLTLSSLPKIIKQLKGKGFTFKAIPFSPLK